MKTQPSRYLYIDILRILSMLAVIFLHSAADLLRLNYGEPVWHFSNVVTAFMSTSVPVFFMISGALLLSGKNTVSVGYTLKKRLPKVLIPFLFWSGAAVAYYFFAGYFYESGVWDLSAALLRIKGLPAEPVTVHLWFMYALIPIYLISPLLKAMMDGLSEKRQNYALLLWLIFSVALPTLRTLSPQSYQGYFALHPTFSLDFFSGYIGFFLLGFVLHTRQNSLKKRTLLVFILANVFLVSLATYYYTTLQGSYYEGFKTYSLIFTASLSAALFLWIKKLLENRQPKKWFYQACSFLSATAFSIYLMHNLVIRFFSSNYFLVPNDGIFPLLLRFVAVFAVSLLLTVVLSSIRPLCFLATGLSFQTACESCNVQFLIKRFVQRNKH